METLGFHDWTMLENSFFFFFYAKFLLQRSDEMQ